MPSKKETIARAKFARDLSQQGANENEIASKLDPPGSVSLVREYLEPNGHGTECPVCGGYGISKDRATGRKRPICDHE